MATIDRPHGSPAVFEAYGLALSSAEETLRRIGAPFAPRRVGIVRRIVRALRRLAGVR